MAINWRRSRGVAPPPADDLDARRAVWAAMATLFLDTDVEAIYLADAARVCAASAYSLPQLEHIWWEEVWPVMRWNLWSVAGAWTPVDPDGLEQAIISGRRRGPRVLPRRWRGAAFEIWTALSERVGTLRRDSA